MTNRRRLELCLVALAVMCLTLAAMVPSPPVQAKAPADVPTRPTPKLTPTPMPSRESPAGAYIEMCVYPPGTSIWTEVQWQGDQEEWYDVAGWQGTPNVSDCVRWYVAPMHFGAGPFRWVIKQSKGGEVLAVSEPFDLPGQSGEVLSGLAIFPD
jgi:hypothetical protein